MRISKLCKKNLKAIEEINKEAFPKEEFVSLTDQLALKDKGFVLYQVIDKTPIAYFSLAIGFDSVYLFFLAVKSDKRNFGIGSKIISHIKKRYKNYQIFVDIEKPDKTAINSLQREKRKAFYLRNGFLETKIDLIYNDCLLEFLTLNKNFDKSKLEKLVNQINCDYYSLKIVK